MRRESIVLFALLFAACSTEPAPEVHRESLVTDGFYFFPPLVAQKPRFTGVFDRTLAPIVQVDRIGAAGKSLERITTFSTTTGRGAQRIRAGKNAYRVRWRTKSSDLKANATYRIAVLVANRQLGFVDMDGATLKKEPLLIRFRIEGGVRPPPPSPDTDRDSIVDEDDNCPTIPNPLQEDASDDGIGDACECLDVVCGTIDGCHEPGVCDSTNGECIDATKPATISCGEDVCAYEVATSCIDGQMVGACGPAFDCPAYPYGLNRIEIGPIVADVGKKKLLYLRFDGAVLETLSGVHDIVRFVRNIISFAYADDIVTTPEMIADLSALRIESCSLTPPEGLVLLPDRGDGYYCLVDSSLAVQDVVASVKDVASSAAIRSVPFTFAGDTCREPGCIAAPVAPIFECLEELTNVSSDFPLPRYVAHFGYINRTGASLEVAIGAQNQLSGDIVSAPAEWLAQPASTKLVQPTQFAPGRKFMQFIVPLDSPHAVWRIGDRSATVTPQSIRCDGLRPAKS